MNNSKAVPKPLPEAFGTIRKTATTRRTGATRIVICFSAIVCLFISSAATIAGTLPTGGDITAGNGSISQAGSEMTIDQTTQNMVIDWQGFSIGENNSVTFDQPSCSATALNRVIGSEVSHIQGALKANGRVFLINPNGVLFSSTASVNVGDLVVSTLNISDEDFMSGNYTFNGDSPGQIINRGDINAPDGGYVVFIAAKIENSGTITANKGGVLLGAGSKVILDLGGPVKLQVEEAAIDALIEQGGAIRADGGLVYISAKAAGDLASTVINHTGITEARTFAMGENGEIYLMGDMENDRIAVGGTLDASAPEAGDGGFIETSAAKVKTEEDVHVTTKSVEGETGTWLIDPNDYTIASSGGDTTGTAVTNSLKTTNVTIETATMGTSGNGDIFVNDSITWSANKLTLDAERNIEINRELNGSGAAQLALYYGQGAVAAGNTATYSINAPVNLPEGNNFSTKLGSNGEQKDFIVITELGDEDSTTGTDLQGMSGNLARYYALGSDIKASGTSEWNSDDSGGYYGFDPIGDNSTKFSGNFDGLGHTVTDLYINRPEKEYVGLFGYTNGSDIRNVGMVDGSVTGKYSVGGLVGWNNNGAVSNSWATGGVTGVRNVGGLVGYNKDNGAVTNSYATGSVTGVDHVGGLVGNNNNAAVSNSYATGSVTGKNYVGGLVGSNDNNGAVEYSYATGSVTGTFQNVGGLVGYNASSAVSNSYATGSVTGVDHVGGLVGWNCFSSTVSNSYWDKETTGQTTSSGSDASYGKTTAEMKAMATFAGWSISNQGGEATTWRIYEGFTYPLLRSFLTATTATVTGSASKKCDGNAIVSGGTLDYRWSVPQPDLDKIKGSPYYTVADKNVGNGKSVSLAGLYSVQDGYDIILATTATANITAPRAATGAEQVYRGFPPGFYFGGGLVFVGLPGYPGGTTGSGGFGTGEFTRFLVVDGGVRLQ